MFETPDELQLIRIIMVFGCVKLELACRRSPLCAHPDKTEVVVAEVVIAKLVFSYVLKKRSWLNASS